MAVDFDGTAGNTALRRGVRPLGRLLANDLANELAEHWLSAIADGGVRAALEGVYATLNAEVVQRGPVCDASGRCCNFEAYGHRLYVTGLEAAYTVTRLAERPWGSPAESAADRGTPGRKGGAVSLVQIGRVGVAAQGDQSAHADGALPAPPRDVALSRATLEAARARGGCPFQVGGLCAVHPIRPLGCRVYYCDPTAQDWQQELSERLLGEIRGIHDRYEVDYRYGEWRAMLEVFLVSEGPCARRARPS